jgi:hypothetical protein
MSWVEEEEEASAKEEKEEEEVFSVVLYVNFIPRRIRFMPFCIAAP